MKKKKRGKGKKKGPKKKKKKQPQKKNNNAKSQNQKRSDDDLLMSLANSGKKKEVEYDISKGQTSPEPMIPLDKFYPDGNFPVNEVIRYRTSSDVLDEENELEVEKKHLEVYKDMRKSAEVHRQVRKWIRSFVKPGMKMIDIANKIEDKVELLSGFDKSNSLKCGLGFPIGLSLNECAAHYTPNSQDKRVLKKDDVLCIDIGVHSKGIICDAAFTLTWNDRYHKLLTAVEAATNEGVKLSGVDARIYEIGCGIQEVMESYSVELDGKDFPVNVVKNLCGHGIDRYKIHTGVRVSCNKDTKDKTERMKENHFYAIETY